MIRRTEYQVRYQGSAVTGPWATLEAASRSLEAEAVRTGRALAAYTLVHRTVTYGDWAPTTRVVTR